MYDKLLQFYEEAGGFGVLMLQMGRDHGSREGRERSMNLFWQHVAPRLRALDPIPRAPSGPAPLPRGNPAPGA